jgi:hypothetical protein
MKRLAHVLEEHRIPYWLDSGTLIGSFRHDAPMPWDDDNDIGVLEEDLMNNSTYETLRSAIERAGMQAASWRNDAYPHDRNIDHAIVLPQVFSRKPLVEPHLDFFIVRRVTMTGKRSWVDWRPGDDDNNSTKKSIKNARFGLRTKRFDSDLVQPWKQRDIFSPHPPRFTVGDNRATANVTWVEHVPRYGFLGRAKFGDRWYPVPADVERYLYCWYDKTASQLVLRNRFISPHAGMNAENLGVDGEYCESNYAQVSDMRRRPDVAIEMLHHLNRTYGDQGLFRVRNTRLFKAICGPHAKLTPRCREFAQQDAEN